MQAALLRSKYPSLVPVILVTELQLKKNKLLFPQHESVGMLLFKIRQLALDISFKDALFVTVRSYDGDQIAISAGKTLDELYNSHGSSDGFLYLYVTKESVFG